jgi:hypothetical protein
MIARLQMSDLHLGDPRSVLGDPEVVRKVTDDLAHLSGGHVGKLILAGDVWEESVPANLNKREDGIAQSVYLAATRFFVTLYRKVQIDEIVVVPGNHDVCTWHWYHKQASRSTFITGSDGIWVDPLTWPWSILLGGYSDRVTFAYPLYWDKRATGSRATGSSAGDDYPALFVTHGHLLDPLVLGEDPSRVYLALQAIGVGRPLVKSLENADSVAEIARCTLDFCLGLWKRYSSRDYVYANYVMRRLEHPQSCLLQGSSIEWIDEAATHVDDPVPQQGNFANVPRFLNLMIRDPNLPTPVGTFGGDPIGARSSAAPPAMKPSCLTFGHDHRGTFQQVVACGVPFVAADSGGWTSEWEGHVPHTHVLVWNKVEDVVPAPYLINVRAELGRSKV